MPYDLSLVKKDDEAAYFAFASAPDNFLRDGWVRPNDKALCPKSANRSAGCSSTCWNRRDRIGEERRRPSKFRGDLAQAHTTSLLRLRSWRFSSSFEQFSGLENQDGLVSVCLSRMRRCWRIQQFDRSHMAGRSRHRLCLSSRRLATHGRLQSRRRCVRGGDRGITHFRSLQTKAPSCSVLLIFKDDRKDRPKSVCGFCLIHRCDDECANRHLRRGGSFEVKSQEVGHNVLLMYAVLH